jgi:hypothetical protein
MTDEFLKTIEQFLRDPMSITRMTAREKRFLQKCVEKSKKHRPLSDYNVFVQDRLRELESTGLKPREKIKQIAQEWKQHSGMAPTIPELV